MRRDHLFDYFSTFGNLENVLVCVSDSSGFVKYQEAAVTAKVLKIKDHTIAGRKISVEIAHECHQDDDSTNLAGKELMDVDDDCFSEILTHVTVVDLCSLHELSDIKKNIRLSEIIDEAFRRKYKVCDLNNVVHTVDGAQRLLTDFGHMISHLTANYSGDDGVRIIKSIIQCCSRTLRSLILRNCYFDEYVPKAVFPNLKKLEIFDCDFKRTTNLFAHCKSLVALSVHHTPGSPPNYSTKAVMKHKFRKLESFSGLWDNDSLDSESFDSEVFKNFILRHKNLKTIVLSNPFDLVLLPVITAQCSQLRKLHLHSYRTENPVEYENYVKGISKLKHLVELKIIGDPDALIFIQQLHHLQSLKFLTLVDVRFTPAIVLALTQLKMLEKLDIDGCAEFKNWNAVAELFRLKILSLAAFENVVFDLVVLVSRLAHLENLNLNLPFDLTIDEKTYTRIVNARWRAGSGHRTLQIGCNGIKTVFPSYTY